MSEQTTIAFAGGATLEVRVPVAEVQKLLRTEPAREQSLVALKGLDDEVVFVNPVLVLYVRRSAPADRPGPGAGA